MLIPNHPHEERLAALASGDPDATEDASLTDHVSTCPQCEPIVRELATLRTALADLPDIQPPRPLRLLPEVETPASADRLGGWARRFFAPILTAGAAVALVGLVGTASPMLGSFGAATGAASQELTPAGAPNPSSGDTASEAGGEGRGAAASGDAFEAPGYGVTSTPTTDDGTGVLRGNQTEPMSTDAERSPWPMLLFTGVALMIAAALLRWILVPRAG